MEWNTGRLGFVTCVELGRGCIEEMLALGVPLELVITLADDIDQRKSGRVDLDGLCKTNSIPLRKVVSINDAQAIKAVVDHAIEWLFIVGWSQLAGPGILGAPAKGCLGMHPTLLPHGRGRAPIPWAIIKGLAKTGVTLFRIDDGVDTGDIADQVEIQLEPRETASTLYGKVADTHRLLTRRCVEALHRDELRFNPQSEADVSYWPRRRPEDGRLSPTMSVTDADRLVRGCTHPYPGAFIDTATGRVMIWSGNPVLGKPQGGPREEGLRYVVPFSDGQLVCEAGEWALLSPPDS